MTVLNNINSISSFNLPKRRSAGLKHLPRSRPSRLALPYARLDFTITVPASRSLSQDFFNRSLPINSIVLAPVNTGRSVVKTELGAEQALFGPLVLSGADLIADFSGHIRKGFDSANLIYGTENPIALSALGFTSAFSFVSGGLNIKEGVNEAKRASKISDVTAKSLAYLRIFKGSAQFAGASFMVPMRALTIAAIATASKVYARAAGILGALGGLCFNGVTLAAALSLGIRTREQYQFIKQLNKILNDPSTSEEMRLAHALEHLKQLSSVTNEEKETIRQAVASKEKYRLLSSEQRVEKSAKKERKLLHKKEAYLKRLIDVDCINQIREKGPSEAKSVIEAVKTKTSEKMRTTSIGVGLVAMNTIATIGSFFLVPGAKIFSSVLGLATSVCWVTLDAYALFKNFEAKDPGRYDKLWIFLSTTTAVISVSAVFFFSGGLAPIIAASVVGALWLGINCICYYRLYQLEKRSLELLT